MRSIRVFLLVLFSFVWLVSRTQMVSFVSLDKLEDPSELIKATISLTSYYDEPKVCALPNSNLCDIVYRIGDVILENRDSFVLVKDATTKIQIEFQNVSNSQVFSYDFACADSNVGIQTAVLTLGNYNIDYDQIEDGREISLKITESKFKNVYVYFPKLGTSTSVYLYENSTDHRYLRKLSYDLISQKNYLKFSTNESSRFYVKLQGCYNSEEFWLTLK
ncbi:hypothetical protein N9B82_06580 [Saprospiraceae bacterium]|nr:hypothetical protein [Saprospiraceae bacterium]